MRVLDLDSARLLVASERSAEVNRDRLRLEAEIQSLSETLPDVTLREWLAIGAVLAKRKS